MATRPSHGGLTVERTARALMLDPVISGARLHQMQAAGLWNDALIVDHFDRNAVCFPDRVAVVALAMEDQREISLTFGDLKRLSDRMVHVLRQRGIGPGDIVAVQLPSWWHYLVIYPACARIGAAINPLMPIFRQRELRFMLGFPKTKLLIVANRFRGFDYPAMIDEIRADLPDLKHVLIVGGDGVDDSLERMLADDPPDGMPDVTGLRPSANDVTELMYTSGTTGQPKGVMHTPNTLLCKVRLAQELFRLTEDDVVYMGSPVAHQTGFMYACIMTLVLGIRSVLQDIWDPVVAARLISQQGCTVTVASTPFLSDLVHVPGVRDHDVRSLRLFLCAGAPIPRVLLRHAAATLPDLYVMSAWGMTENGIVTATYPGDAEEKVFETDGRALPFQEVRVVDDAGQPVPPGAEGRLQSRGPTCFVGYFNRPEAYGLSDDLWFETGDNARMDSDGYIRITGRSRDIIIRGGENVPVVEVEELLYRHPDIVDAAVVGVPDARLGERGCALVTLRSGADLTLQALTAFLAGEGMSRNYLPERLEVIDAFPRTPSGKIQKFRLRAQLIARDAADAEMDGGQDP